MVEIITKLYIGELLIISRDTSKIVIL